MKSQRVTWDAFITALMAISAPVKYEVEDETVVLDDNSLKMNVKERSSTAYWQSFRNTTNMSVEECNSRLPQLKIARNKAYERVRRSTSFYNVDKVKEIFGGQFNGQFDRFAVTAKINGVDTTVVRGSAIEELGFTQTAKNSERWDELYDNAVAFKAYTDIPHNVQQRTTNITNKFNL